MFRVMVVVHDHFQGTKKAMDAMEHKSELLKAAPKNLPYKPVPLYTYFYVFALVKKAFV